MNKTQFYHVCEFFGLEEHEKTIISLENLNAIAIKGLHALPYCTLQIHSPNVPEIRAYYSWLYKIQS